jgi:long-chain acyl-CoA synthetase
MSELDTLPKLLLDNAAKHGGEIAMREKQFGIWKPFTWAEIAARTELIALGLKDLGVQKGDVVG